MGDKGMHRVCDDIGDKNGGAGRIGGKEAVIPVLVE
jgi:hypothetical protein